MMSPKNDSVANPWGPPQDVGLRFATGVRCGSANCMACLFKAAVHPLQVPDDVRVLAVVVRGGARSRLEDRFVLRLAQVPNADLAVVQSSSDEVRVHAAEIQRRHPRPVLLLLIERVQN